MTASLKKLLLASLALFFGVMSSGVIAQTNYDFSQTFGSDNLGYTFGTFTGSITTDSSGVITGLSNLQQNSSVLGKPRLVGSGSIDNSYSPISGALIFEFSGSPYGDTFVYIQGAGRATGYAYGFVTPGDAGGVAYATSAASFICTSGCPTSGAPEIDGSLAPKVGFLLGCLFLMFGRKKQQLEPMLTA